MLIPKGSLAGDLIIEDQLSIDLSISSVYLSIYLYIYLTIHLKSVCMYVCVCSVITFAILSYFVM